MVDLRSDTQTKPSAGMREAMAHAEVGDEQEREDPTVLELESRAPLLGQEEAVYLPTATMGQIALAILGERGTELIVEERAHIRPRSRAPPSGLQTRPLPGCRGRLAGAIARSGLEAATSDAARFVVPSRTRTTPPAARSGH
jgi:threonine aldolase